jgi:hypothetical protein
MFMVCSRFVLFPAEETFVHYQETGADRREETFIHYQETGADRL